MADRACPAAMRASGHGARLDFRVNPSYGQGMPALDAIMPARVAAAAQPQALAQSTPLSPSAVRLLESSIAVVNQRIGLAGIRLPKPLDLHYAVEPASASNGSARYTFDAKTGRATIAFDAGFLERAADAERQAAGLGKAVLESLIVNEMHGIVASALAPPGRVSGKASRVAEELSNVASRQYLARHHANQPYSGEAKAVWDRISADIREGKPPYAGRPAGTPVDHALGQEAMQLMGLGGAGTRRPSPR